MSSAELYDPATGIWAATGTLATGRAEHRATLLANGKVLVMGGIGDSYNALSSAELYDGPIPMPTAMVIANPTKLPGGWFQFVLTNTPGVSFSALAATNPALPLSDWTVLGGVPEVAPGQFQFADPQAANIACRFYRLRAP